MITRLLAGAACAALLGFSMPVSAATNPQLVGAAVDISPSDAQAVSAFTSSLPHASLWRRKARDSGAARALIGVLTGRPSDGLENGPALAAQAQSLLLRAQAGDPAALSAADRLLSAAWVSYVEVLQRPTNGMIYADLWAAPRRDSPMQILQRTAAEELLVSLCPLRFAGENS